MENQKEIQKTPEELVEEVKAKCEKSAKEILALKMEYGKRTLVYVKNPSVKKANKVLSVMKMTINKLEKHAVLLKEFGTLSGVNEVIKRADQSKEGSTDVSAEG